MQESNDAGKAGNNPQHGGHDSGDTGITRSGSRRATCPGEASRESDDKAYDAKSDKTQTVTRSHELHPSHRKKAQESSG